MKLTNRLSRLGFAAAAGRIRIVRFDRYRPRAFANLARRFAIRGRDFATNHRCLQIS